MSKRLFTFINCPGCGSALKNSYEVEFYEDDLDGTSHTAYVFGGFLEDCLCPACAASVGIPSC